MPATRLRPSATTLLAAAVLVLLPALAILQYRWLGQVSENERTRLQRAVLNAMRGVAQDLDGQLARAIDRLDLSRRLQGDGMLAGAFPSSPLVRDVLYVQRPAATDDRLELRRCDPVTLVCAAAEWPDGFDALRRDLTRTIDRGSGREAQDLSRTLSVNGVAEPVIVLPLGKEGRAHDRRRLDFALVVLDDGWLRTNLVPQLVERHFGPAAATDFRVTVVARRAPLDIVYRDALSDVQRLLDAPEAWEELFTLRENEFSEDGRDEGGLWAADRPVRVFDRDGDDDDEEWLLLAQHRDGSLQVAVDNLKRRNLFVSFGIVALMAIAVGLMVVTSRRAQRLAAQQIEFVAGVSHEFRTPVSAIHLAAQNLADGTVADPGRVRRYGAAIQAESQRLRDTVDRVLQFAALNAGQPGAPAAPMDLAALIDEVVAATRREHAQAEITTVLPSELPAIVGDPLALRACLQNVLSNALKYGGRPPKVKIEAAVRTRRRTREVQLSVDDNGPGIESRDLPHIFEPFYRGRNALERRIQGSGLGLHLVRRMIGAHGGRISARRSPTGGSSFIIHLPLEPSRVTS